MNDLSRKTLEAIGWSYNDIFGTWVNSFGGSVTEPPEVSENKNLAEIVVSDHFRSFGVSVRGSHTFFEKYDRDLSAKEICELALAVLSDSK